MKKRRRIVLPLLFTCLMCSPRWAHADFGQGRPVTAADLAGKKFCFESGGWEHYWPNGRMTSSHGGGIWSVPQPGLIHHKYSYMQLEILPDGRLHGFRKCTTCSGDLDIWASQCN
jgi:hypothetical protein